jgi:hypothetical protein
MENLPVLGSDVKVCTCPVSAYLSHPPALGGIAGGHPQVTDVRRNLQSLAISDGEVLPVDVCEG